MQRQKGIGLVELLISAFLASFLIIMVMQHYLLAKKQYLYLQRLLEEDFELQLVNDLVRDRIRQAGFTPCLSINSLKTHNWLTGQTNLVAINTKMDQVLQINRMSEHFTTVIQLLSADQLVLAATLQFAPHQHVLIADCYHAEVVSVVSAKQINHRTMLRVSPHLAFDYIEPVYIGEWMEESFFIKKNRQGNDALFYRQKHTEELSAYIKKMLLTIKHHSGRTLVDIIWELQQSKYVEIETEVRAG